MNLHSAHLDPAALHRPRHLGRAAAGGFEGLAEAGAAWLRRWLQE